MEQKTNDQRSIRMFVSSMLIFGTIGVFRRYIPLPSAFLAFTRGIIGGLCILLLMRLGKKGGREPLARRDLLMLVVSGALIGFNWMLLFEAYNHTTVAVATLCYYMAPTIVILLIMQAGSIMSVGYEKVYLMQNSSNLTTSEVISTYTFKIGLQDSKYSYSAAIGLFNNVINFFMLIIVNQITEILKKISLNGTTILLIEQNAKKALELCDRAYVMNAGRITLEGTGDELLENQELMQAYLGE